MMFFLKLYAARYNQDSFRNLIISTVIFKCDKNTIDVQNTTYIIKRCIYVIVFSRYITNWLFSSHSSFASYISFLHESLESLKKSASVEFVNSDCSPKVTIFTKKVIFMVTYSQSAAIEDFFFSAYIVSSKSKNFVKQLKNESYQTFKY